LIEANALPLSQIANSVRIRPVGCWARPVSVS